MTTHKRQVCPADRSASILFAEIYFKLKNDAVNPSAPLLTVSPEASRTSTSDYRIREVLYRIRDYFKLLLGIVLAFSFYFLFKLKPLRPENRRKSEKSERGIMARSRRRERVSADRLQIVPAEELASPITDLASQIYTYSRMEAQL